MPVRGEGGRRRRRAGGKLSEQSGVGRPSRWAGSGWVTKMEAVTRERIIEKMAGRTPSRPAEHCRCQLCGASGQESPWENRGLHALPRLDAARHRAHGVASRAWTDFSAHGGALPRGQLVVPEARGLLIQTGPGGQQNCQAGLRRVCPGAQGPPLTSVPETSPAAGCRLLTMCFPPLGAGRCPATYRF